MWRNDNIWTRNLKVLIAADQRWLRTTQLRSCGTVISKKDKQLLANQQDVVADKEQKTAVLIDVTGTAGRRGTKKSRTTRGWRNNSRRSGRVQSGLGGNRSFPIYNHETRRVAWTDSRRNFWCSRRSTAWLAFVSSIQHHTQWLVCNALCRSTTVIS